jgi:hypothetical protein
MVETWRLRPKGNKIIYETELVPVKDEWIELLPESVDMSFNSMDRTLMTGLQRASIDVTSEHLADYYLVITGPKSQPTSSRGTTRLFKAGGALSLQHEETCGRA